MVECDPSKIDGAGSNPVSRSKTKTAELRRFLNQILLFFTLRTQLLGFP